MTERKTCLIRVVKVADRFRQKGRANKGRAGTDCNVKNNNVNNKRKERSKTS